MRKPLHPISSLIIKYLEGTITPFEEQELDKWINESKENSDLFDELYDEYRMNADLIRRIVDSSLSREQSRWLRKKMVLLNTSHQMM